MFFGFIRSISDGMKPVFSFGKTICVGHASLVKAVVDRLNDPNLKCRFISVDVTKKHTSAGHAMCIVDILDNKYNIKGSYAEDVCYDAGSPYSPEGKGLANCMYPVEDFNNRIEGPIKLSLGSRVGNKEETNMYKYYSWVEPIPVEKSKRALKNVYKRTIIKKDMPKLVMCIKEDMLNSCFYAKNTYLERAKNPYLEYADENFDCIEKTCLGKKYIGIYEKDDYKK